MPRQNIPGARRPTAERGITVASKSGPKRLLRRVRRTGDVATDYRSGQALAARVCARILDQQDGTILSDLVVAMVRDGRFGAVEAGLLDHIGVAAATR
jgi:hypothetical protein